MSEDKEHLNKMQEALYKIIMTSSPDHSFEIASRAIAYLTMVAGLEEISNETHSRWYDEVRNCRGDFL